MAMEATELMVGDLVNIKGKPVKVTLDDLRTMLILFEDVDFHIEPIGLTEDILVKNGFEKFAESQTLFDYTDNDIHLEYWIGDGCFRYYTAEIHYVHELQHLLRLIGVEKEIEL